MGQSRLEIAPELKRVVRDVQKELDYRLNQQVRAVADIAGRRAVRQLRQKVSDTLPKISKGANPDKFFKDLVRIIAADDKSGPILERIVAITAVAHLARMGKISLSSQDESGRIITEAIASDPFPRGGPILLGALKAVIEDEGDLDAVEKVGYGPALGNTNEVDKWRRKIMAEEAAAKFRKNPDLSMILPEWEKGGPNSDPSVPGEMLKGPAAPKFVVKLQTLYRSSKDPVLGSRQVLVSHICSPEMQWVTAAKGMPRSNNYSAVDLLNRNPSIVREFERLDFDKARDGSPRVRRQGLLLNAVNILTDNKLGVVNDLINSQGGLNSAQVSANLEASGLEYILAVRVLRRLKNQTMLEQRAGISKAVELELKRLRKEVMVIETEDGQEKKSQTVTIASAYLQQFKRENEGTPQEKCSLEDLINSLTISTTALLCTFDGSGQRVVRTEADLYRVINNLIDKAIDPIDAKKFPELVSSKLFATETIQRRSTPQGATPPTRYEEDQEWN